MNKLVEQLTRNIQQPQRVYPAFNDLAEKLSIINSFDLSESALIIGGSAGRGESCVTPYQDNYHILSDLDLLWIYQDTLPTTPITEAVTAIESATQLECSIYTLPQKHFARLQTPLGKDYKQYAITFGDWQPDTYPPITTTPYDAAEVWIYGLIELLENFDAIESLSQQNTQAFLYQVHHICMYLIRSVILLKGGYCYHDIDCLPANLKHFAQSQLDWRDGLTNNNDFSSQSLQQLILMTYQEHQQQGCLTEQKNSVENFKYIHHASGQYVAHYQDIATSLILDAVKNDNWRDMTHIRSSLIRAWQHLHCSKFTIPHITTSPFEWFYKRKKQFRDSLLWMKIVRR